MTPSASKVGKMMDQRRMKMRPPQRFEWSDLQRRGLESRGGRSLVKQSLAGAMRDIEKRRSEAISAVSESEGNGHDIAHDLESAGRIAMASLRLEGIPLAEADVVETLLKSGVRGDLRNRQAQMIRNHVAIQLHIERCLKKRCLLKPAMVLGWYSSLSAGLPMVSLDAGRMRRLEDVCRRVNSPPMQLESAVRDIAQLYCNLISDALVPSFNGVLVRLIMRYHLGRCSLPRVIFREELAGARDGDDQRAYTAMVLLLESSVRGGHQGWLGGQREGMIGEA